ncbi:MAG: response regulator [Gammaproteobacteria bacterium]|nr:response regulator [Gammaproteobacteria bacterium]
MSTSVLYIEDSHVNHMVMERMILSRPGFDYQHASTGQRGLDILENMAPDIVLLDMNLPDMHGMDVYRQIRQNPSLSTIPVIAVSADAMRHDVKAAIKQGLSAYVTKPVKMDSFLDNMDAVLARHRSKQSPIHHDSSQCF